MDWNNPILYLAFFAPHLMFEHLHLQPPTPLNEEIKREFTPMTISQGQSAEASLGVSSQMSNTLELLVSIRDILSSLQLNSVGEVFNIGEVFNRDEMQVDLGEDDKVDAVSQKSGAPQDAQSF